MVLCLGVGVGLPRLSCGCTAVCVWVSVLAGGLGSFAAQKFVVRLPSFWGWFLCGLVLGESCYSRRGICLDHFRDEDRLV
jgi:hypothetical protein